MEADEFQTYKREHEKYAPKRIQCNFNQSVFGLFSPQLPIQHRRTTECADGHVIKLNCLLIIIGTTLSGLWAEMLLGVVRGGGRGVWSAFIMATKSAIVPLAWINEGTKLEIIGMHLVVFTCALSSAEYSREHRIAILNIAAAMTRFAHLLNASFNGYSTMYNWKKFTEQRALTEFQSRSLGSSTDELMRYIGGIYTVGPPDVLPMLRTETQLGSGELRALDKTTSTETKCFLPNPDWLKRCSLACCIFYHDYHLSSALQRNMLSKLVIYFFRIFC